MKTEILPGQKFGRLIVEAEGEPYYWRGRPHHRQWICLCECGRTILVAQGSLRRGATRSCGCLLRETTKERAFRHGAKCHGDCKPEYRIWIRLKRNPNDVCASWIQGDGVGFSNFLLAVGARPSHQHYLVRINIEREWAKDNVKWIRGSTGRQQPRKLVEFQGKLIGLRELAGILGITYGALTKRAERGKIPKGADDMI